MSIIDRDIRGAALQSPFASSGTTSGAVTTEGVTVEYHTLSAGEIIAKAFTLSFTPLVPARVLADLVGGGAQVYSTDFLISVDVFDFNGLGLDGELIANDIIRISYSNSLSVEYRTLTAGEVAAFALTLAATPGDPTAVRADLISGSAQVYSVDFVVSGNVLDWTGLGLVGVLAGDILRITYEG